LPSRLAEQLEVSPHGRNPREALRNRARAFVASAVQDPFRFQLLFERPIAGFVPSPESLAIGVAGLDETRRLAEGAGLRGQRPFHLFVAATRGLVALQIANEPGAIVWSASSTRQWTS
jgi:hypothetical protein